MKEHGTSKRVAAPVAKWGELPDQEPHYALVEGVDLVVIRLFLGWFGPRGLATILFALLVAEAEAIASHERLFHIATLAVAASILAHGMTASPLAAVYGKWVERLRSGEPDAPECRLAPELPVRIRTRQQREASRGSR